MQSTSKTALQSPRICILGLGYIGLPTACLLAERGYRVHGVDTNPQVVERIKRQGQPFAEAELGVLVQSALRSENLSISNQPIEADIYIIAVPTPLGAGNAPDLSHIEAATDAISPYIYQGSLVILESTSPVGTTEAVASRLQAHRRDLARDGHVGFNVAYCPERVLPGRIIAELVQNARIVGGIDGVSTERAVSFYRTFVEGEIFGTDARTAELTKLAENAYRDVNIAYANELSLVCSELNINVHEVIGLANRHPRVRILEPGPGVGGHCIAVDPWFIVSSAPASSHLIRAAREVNLAKTQWVIDRVRMRAERFDKPIIACLGLTYKPDVDDLRGSPALTICQALNRQLDTTVIAVDPFISGIEGIQLVSLEEALERSDILVALVGHQLFRQIKRERISEKVVIDACGVFL